MNTISILIGNSDNKLSQKEWSIFVQECIRDVSLYATQIYFQGCTNSDSKYQSFCIVFLTDASSISNLIRSMDVLRQQFNQESIAVVIGETTLVS